MCKLGTYAAVVNHVEFGRTLVLLDEKMKYLRRVGNVNLKCLDVEGDLG